MKYILFPEGRILPNGGSFTYEYHVKDHLGSVRVAFTPTGSEKIVVQENTYYPSGAPIADMSWNASLSTNRYKHTGMETIEDFSLNYLDNSARWRLNVSAPMFMGIDPMAEKYYGISPYAYCGNNPIRFIDPDGRMFGDPDEPKWSLWGMIKDYFTTWTSSFSLTGDNSRGQVYEKAYVQNDQAAQEQVKKIETVEAVANTKVTPYVSISVGKQTGEGSPVSMWTGVTLTPDGLYGSAGADVSVGMPGILTGVSISVSAGVTLDFSKGTQTSVPGVLNSNGGLPSLLQGDFLVGGGAGSVVGFSASSTNVRIPLINNTPTPTYSFEATFTNSPLWISGNTGYMFPILTW